MTVPGIFAALVERERHRLNRTPLDPRCPYMHDHGCEEPPEACQPDRRPLNALEAGEPQCLQGRQLKMLLPPARRRRDDAMQWFEVRADDTIRPCDPPE